MWQVSVPVIIRLSAPSAKDLVWDSLCRQQKDEQGGSASLARPRGICMYGLQHKRLYRRNWTATNDYYWGHQSIETIQCLPQGLATIGYMVHPSLYKYQMWQVFQPSHNSIIMLKDKEPSRKISVQFIKQGFIKLAANYAVLEEEKWSGQKAKRTAVR